MAINLEPDLKARIDRLIAERGYENAGQLLADALDSLETDISPSSDAEIDEVKALIDEADADDTAFTLDEVRNRMDAIFAEIEAKLPK